MHAEPAVPTMKGISRTVWILGLISLFTDTASEMLYPVMPIRRVAGVVQNAPV
jgi:hypothetical protein